MLWQSAPSGSRVVAGATDLLPWAREGRAGDVHLPSMVDLSRVAELGGYQLEGNKLRLGANVVYQQFLTDKTLQEHLPSMPFCAVWFADDQIREQATLVGNLVNASPAADGTPPMLLHDATLEIAALSNGSVATRSITLKDFIQGPGKTDLQPNEIVTAVTVDSLRGYGGSFQKVGQRRSLVISVVCAAASIKLDPTSQIVEDLRLSIGGVGPVPIRLHDVEDHLRGKVITLESLKGISSLPMERVASRTRQAYRRTVVQGFVEAAVLEAIENCGVTLPLQMKDKTHD